MLVFFIYKFDLNFYKIFNELKNCHITEYNRPGACMKGLFTRQRQPKMAGHVMRLRYWNLAEHYHNSTIPTNYFTPFLRYYDVKN